MYVPKRCPYCGQSRPMRPHGNTGNKSRLGHKHSPESIAKMSASAKVRTRIKKPKPNA